MANTKKAAKKAVTKKAPAKKAAEPDVKALRAKAVELGIKYVGVKTETLAKLVAQAKPVKKAKAKKDVAVAAPAKPAKKAESKKTRVFVPVSDKDANAVATLKTKKERCISLRRAGYSLHAIARALEMHPTNVARYLRDAKMTKGLTIPAERIKRIKKTIDSKKG